MKVPPEILGSQFGIRFTPRGDGPKDDGVLFQILSEDDGVWHEKDVVASTWWLDDLYQVVKLARAAAKKPKKRASDAKGAT